jgi:hypothetical protein
MALRNRARCRANGAPSATPRRRPRRLQSRGETRFPRGGIAILDHVLDVAASVHFHEALLATLAIVVWHFYTVIFDLDVYPMDTAWLTGVSVKEPDPCAAPPETREDDHPAGVAAGRETVSK